MFVLLLLASTAFCRRHHSRRHHRVHRQYTNFGSEFKVEYLLNKLRVQLDAQSVADYVNEFDMARKNGQPLYVNYRPLEQRLVSFIQKYIPRPNRMTDKRKLWMPMFSDTWRYAAKAGVEQDTKDIIDVILRIPQTFREKLEIGAVAYVPYNKGYSRLAVEMWRLAKEVAPGATNHDLQGITFRLWKAVVIDNNGYKLMHHDDMSLKFAIDWIKQNLPPPLSRVYYHSEAIMSLFQLIGMYAGTFMAASGDFKIFYSVLTHEDPLKYAFSKVVVLARNVVFAAQPETEQFKRCLATQGSHYTTVDGERIALSQCFSQLPWDDTEIGDRIIGLWKNKNLNKQAKRLSQQGIPSQIFQ